MRWFVEKILKPRWIKSTTTEEFGLRILGVNIYYYKRSVPIVGVGHFRYVGEKEFGHTIHPIPKGRHVHSPNAR